MSPAYQAAVWQPEKAESREPLLDTDVSLLFNILTLYSYKTLGATGREEQAGCNILTINSWLAKVMGKWNLSQDTSAMSFSRTGFVNFYLSLLRSL